MTDTPVSIPTSQAFIKALPWIVLIFVFSFVAWAFWEPFFCLFMDAKSAQFASIGMATMAAYALCLMSFAEYWPLAGIQNKWARGIAMIVLAKVVAALFWIGLACGGLDVAAWAFPIIANSWLILAVTTFVGADAHLKDIPPVRRMLLNLLISVGATIVLVRTIVMFPAYWFPFLQATIVTGGLGYVFRRVRQPTYTVIVFALLMLLMWVGLQVASFCGHFALESAAPSYWLWNLGTGSAEFGIFFALTCGLNFSVFACTQGWPFCRIRQPWGTPVALLCMLVWCLVLTRVLMALFQSLVAGDQALWQAQVMAWHTVFWGFAWVFCFGVGQTPYLWAGQKTPGTWDDVE